jgi:hypothetical protein
MDDRVGLGVENGLTFGARVEQIELDWRGPEGADTFSTVGGVMGADHLVSGINQLGNKSAADRAACPHDKDSHRVLLSMTCHISGV